MKPVYSLTKTRNRATAWACSLGLVFLLFLPFTLLAENIKIEAENAVLHGVEVATNVAGYSGTGYVWGFDKAEDNLSFTFSAPAGLYELTIQYYAPYGDKYAGLQVNSTSSEQKLANTGSVFSSVAIGQVQLLEGQNNITINSNWGWYGIDYIALTPVNSIPDVSIPVINGKIEAEKGLLNGVEVVTTTPGYSGEGYVSGFDNGTDKIKLPFDAKAGLYEVLIQYTSPYSDKGYDLQVNSEKGGGMFPKTGDAFGTVNAGKFLLHDGQNIITIGNGWDYFGIDYITIKPTTAPLPAKPPKQLSDARATSSTKALFSYMVDMYGSKVLSGQQEDVEYIRSQTGKYPAIGAFDLMDYSPSRIERGANPAGNSESYISWAKKEEGRGIISLSWHWNAPTDLLDEAPDKLWWSGFYTRATTFDLAAALADKNSERYKLLIRDIDAIAVQLKKFQDADVPVLWRPLHEAAGGWFWWGAKGPDAIKELWQIMYERLENYHQLHNLIWVYTASTDMNWYPGDSYVDVVGLDIYTDPSANMSGDWAAMQASFGGKKLVALSESGTLPDPDKVRGYGTWWSWFSVWSGGFIKNQPLSLLQRVYNDEDVITRDELPDWRAYGRPSVRITQPAEDATFLVCQPPVLQATATNAHGSVAKVTFLANGQVIGTDSVGSDGWQVTWTSPTAGTNSITAEATSPDGIVGASSPVSLTIKADDVPPAITVSSAGTTLWPANHKFVTLKVSDFVTGLSDNCGSVPAVKIKQVSSDEAVNASGTGNTARDIIISDDGLSVQLRAERSGNGNGRVYTIQVAAADQYGNTGTAAYEVQVPHDQQKAAQADAAAYTVNEHNITSVSAGAALSGASYVEAAESTVVVYPNPATSNHITIEIYADNAQTVTISLLSATSQKMVKIQKSLETGNNVLQLPLDKVSDGMYVLLVEKENEQITRKLIIAR